MADAGVCEPLIASFENGLVMKLIRGSVLTQQNVSDRKIATTTAVEISRMHSNLTLLPNEKSEKFAEQIEGFLRLIPDIFSSDINQNQYKTLDLPSKKEIRQALEDSKRNFDKQITPLVACHNDLLLNNFLYEDDTDSITIIDYEYLAPNPAAFDIANHFNEYAGTENVSYI